MTHTPSHSLHTPRLSRMHLLNLPLTSLPHFYNDKLNSLFILQSGGPHPYLDILFLTNALLFCCNVSRKNAPHNTSLPQSHPSFSSLSLIAFPHCRLYFSNVGCIYPMLGLGGRPDIRLSINNVSCGKSQLICVRLSPSVALPEYTDRKRRSDKAHTSQHYQAACIANEDPFVV